MRGVHAKFYRFFLPDTPHTKTPQDTIQRPETIYGVTKVTGEMLSDYYARRFGVDTRSVRFRVLFHM